jgi:hypothetical protein
MSNNIENLKNECLVIENNARYTAETHHIMASSSKFKANCIEIIPAIFSAIFLSLLVVGEEVPIWFGLVAIISAISSTSNIILNPQRSYYENLNAAKNFIVIKNRAKSLGSLGNFYTEKEFYEAFKALSESYNQLILMTPPTEEKAYKKAIDKLSNC